MQKVELEMLNNVTNCAVVKLPDRRFPGIVIQGDTLWSIYSSVSLLKDLCKDGNLEEAIDESSDLIAQLSGYLQVYESALNAHGINKPYNGGIGAS
jgi:hypothetical protein